MDKRQTGKETRRPLTLMERILFYTLKGSNEVPFLCWWISILVSMVEKSVVPYCFPTIDNRIVVVIGLVSVILSCTAAGWIKTREDVLGIS